MSTTDSVISMGKLRSREQTPERVTDGEKAQPGRASTSGIPEILALLPRKAPLEYPRKHQFYGPGQPCSEVFLVLTGRVVISNSLSTDNSSVTCIVGAEGVFGEGLLAGTIEPGETAIALDPTRVVGWAPAEVENQILRYPQLGMALMRYFVHRCAELNTRIEGLALRKTRERVMLNLIQLAHRLGAPTVTGSFRLAPLTHHALADYVGTTREIVTSLLTGFRRQGLMQYSRRYIEVDVSAMREALRNLGVETERAAGQLSAGGA